MLLALGAPDHRWVPARVADLSAGGAALHLDRRTGLAVGTPVLLRVPVGTLPGGLQLRGRVTRRAGSRHVGVAFEGLHPTQRDHLVRVVLGLERDALARRTAPVVPLHRGPDGHPSAGTTAP